ncbi:MAG: tRNA (adenosine(37)-N6)-threonylcarbamoyltransferase complex ATPase subunit type 1 TsaE [Planctomycetaceae bacterium]|nr:tRNA (adenosine(37)-N6)-threonylcarbamoyltransferase complex ATPase subunit type 1 TsaE [Planctomycetaceae bacterium]
MIPLPQNQIWFTSTEAETLAVGRQLAQNLPDGAIVSLEGTLGAGKSILVRGIASGLGIDPETVTSPTFTLWQSYHGLRELHHLDVYRLQDPAEFLDLGVEELFQSDGLAIIEWGEKVRSVLPPDHYRVMIEIDEQTNRRIELVPPGQQV